MPVQRSHDQPADHLCRVIDAFVEMLVLSELGFERAKAAETGRPGYDPRDLLKLYLYGYLNQIRSLRRLEAECRRNVELMWLLGRPEPEPASRGVAPPILAVLRALPPKGLRLQPSLRDAEPDAPSAWRRRSAAAWPRPDRVPISGRRRNQIRLEWAHRRA